MGEWLRLMDSHKAEMAFIIAFLASVIAIYLLHSEKRRKHHRKLLVMAVIIIAVMAIYSHGITLAVIPAYLMLRWAGIHLMRPKVHLDSTGHVPLNQRDSRYIPNYIKVAASVKAGGRCQICGKPVGNDPQFDHIIPWSRGGKATVDNIQLLCGTCNRKKSDHI